MLSMKYNNMLSVLLLLSLLGASFTGRSQTLDRFVIGVAGGTSSSGNTQLEYTVGEVAITTLETGTFILNQGFHQSNPPFNTSVEDVIPISLSYKLYPNPTQGNIRLELEAAKMVDIKIRVYDAQGRITSVTEQRFSRQKIINTELDLSQQAAGLYFIRIISPDGAVARSFKVEKK